MSLDKMIADAQKRAEESEGEEKAKAEAQVEALTEAKEAGYTLTQDDLNRVDKQNKDALNALRQDMERTLGTGWDEFKKTLEETLSDEEGEDAKEGDKDNPLLQRMFSELATRDDALEEEKKARLRFMRELKQERLSHDLERRFKDLGLQDPYHEAAREFVSPRLESIVDKAMEGEEIDEDLKAQAERLKELSPVWFEKPPDPDDVMTPRLPSGRLPRGGEPRQLTDAERLERSESVI